MSCLRTTKGYPTPSSAPTARFRARLDRQLDHELELAAVIGRRMRDVEAREAAGGIFGYTIWNDLSARDVQRREMPIGLGPGKAKDWDGSDVLGPCLVTANDFDVSSAQTAVRVNGELWGESSTAEMHHSFADMIAYASLSQALYPRRSHWFGTATAGSAWSSAAGCRRAM